MIIVTDGGFDPMDSVSYNDLLKKSSRGEEFEGFGV